MKHLLEKNPLILMEAAIVEPLRRSSGIQLHDTLANAPLIYDPSGRNVMSRRYQNYIDIAIQFKLPMLLCTPTWRASRSRVAASRYDTPINIDAVHFMQAIRQSCLNQHAVIKIGGMLGCKHDAYKPDQGLTVSESQRYHAWQIDQLVEGGVDFLIAETLPNVEEALGLAKAMATTETPYLISFVISRDGCVLDGRPLSEAVAYIDAQVRVKPLGYMVNCAHPSFLCPDRQPEALFKRLIGYQANASSLDHADLDNAPTIEADNLSAWGDLMLNLHRQYGISILGGCCGTNDHHLHYLARYAGKPSQTD